MHLRTESLSQDFKHLANAFCTQTPFERFSVSISSQQTLYLPL